MITVSLAEAQSRLSELIDLVMAGDQVSITRQGKPVAHLSAARPRKTRIDAADLRAVTDQMAYQAESAATFIRKMRDEGRF